MGEKNQYRFKKNFNTKSELDTNVKNYRNG